MNDDERTISFYVFRHLYGKYGIKWNVVAAIAIQSTTVWNAKKNCRFIWFEM